ncbi:MAG TPA: pantothenate kinase [Leptolyngbyaceae cyanobacterium M65_K2018_010]|nr:pantothenate kinase [Leptolyngbyaceae cyanobacterium M65_K2018_010]
MDIAPSQLWLGLVIGNSRLHWGAFAGDRWLGGWHTSHLCEDQAQILIRGGFLPPAWLQVGILPPWPEDLVAPGPIPIWGASVVRSQWQNLAAYPQIHPIETPQVPLADTYDGFGVDRALTLVGAGSTYGWPVLVVDCGTALTFTAGVAQRLLGGAILPGLRLQLQALHDHTDGLPQVSLDLDALPCRWARTTAAAMASGVLYTQLAGLHDFLGAWWAAYPTGAVVLTGGDSEVLAARLVALHPDWADRLRVDLNLMFWGLRLCRQGGAKVP